jgi:hypothetical protein
VNIKENPITRVTEKGVLTADGTLHELDVLVCATCGVPEVCMPCELGRSRVSGRAS